VKFIIFAAAFTPPKLDEDDEALLENCFLTDLNFGDLDYNRDELANITCSLRMDRCILIY
jgi:hypothetical protein